MYFSIQDDPEKTLQCPVYIGQNNRNTINLTLPKTGIKLTVRHRDVLSTAGLAAQLLSICITFCLVIYGLRIHGQVITVHDFYVSWICHDLAFLLITFIDPMICLLFGRAFRAGIRSVFPCFGKGGRPEMNQGISMVPVSVAPMGEIKDQIQQDAN